MLWSILIASIPERFHSVQPLLYNLLETQGVARNSEVELLYFMDNRRRSVGSKRNALLDMAHGEYLSFIDDDDDVATTYVNTLYKTIAKTRRGDKPVDVICFPQRATLAPHGIIHECTYSLNHWKDREPNKRRQLLPLLDGSGKPRQDALAWSGPPAHTMVWRSEVAFSARFPPKQFGEDVDWVDAVCAKAEREIQIVGEPLYLYKFDSERSATR